jgi:hypothetical protein
LFFRRGVPGGDDAWVTEKIWIFTIGALVAMVGMLLDHRGLMALAALLLLVGVLLRFVPRGGGGDGVGNDAGRGSGDGS